MDPHINPKTGVWDDNYYNTLGKYGLGNADPEFQDIFRQFSGDINKAADNLINQANGDYDFAAKWIEAEYKKAAGTDDQARKDFLKQVANAMEEKVGRIQFDYETGKYRLGEDRQTIESNRDLLLKRLNEDEVTETKNLLRETKQGKQETLENLNQRGLITGNQSQGLSGEAIRDYDTEVNDRFSALERAFGRGKEDVNLAAKQDLLSNTRSLEDLTTQSRRGLIDTEDTKAQGLEEAQRLKERRKAEAEAQRTSALKGLSATIGRYG